MEIDAIALGMFLASQALQTVQLWVVGRRLSKATLVPPPMLPPAAAAINPFCLNCGTLTPPSELIMQRGLCASCLGTNPTDRPYVDPHDVADMRRRKR